MLLVQHSRQIVAGQEPHLCEYIADPSPVGATTQARAQMTHSSDIGGFLKDRIAPVVEEPRVACRGGVWFGQFRAACTQHSTRLNTLRQKTDLST